MRPERMSHGCKIRRVPPVTVENPILNPAFDGPKPALRADSDESA